MPSWISIGFQDFRRWSIFYLVDLHNHAIVIILRVLVVISYSLLLRVSGQRYHKFLAEGVLIETIWSIIPTFLLIGLVVPSMKILYWVEDTFSFLPQLTLKVVAHQWYWTYVLPYIEGLCYKVIRRTYSRFEYDSLIAPDMATPRLLGVTSYLHLPLLTTARLLISSRDVLHAFAVPSIGLKVDAVPGRINQLFCTPSRVGVFFGQCSEICGANHSFIPIAVKVTPKEDYIFFTNKALFTVITQDLKIGGLRK